MAVSKRCTTRITVEQTGSPIRRHYNQRETLIALGLTGSGSQLAGKVGGT